MLIRDYLLVSKLLSFGVDFFIVRLTPPIVSSKKEVSRSCGVFFFTF